MLRNIRAFVVRCLILLRPRRRWARFSLLTPLLAVTARWIGWRICLTRQGRRTPPFRTRFGRT